MTPRVVALTLCLTAVLGGCQTAADETRKSERKAAWAKYQDCLVKSARELDDGSQDTLTVALAVKARCGPDFLAVANAHSAGLAPGYREMFIADVERDQLDMAATAVASRRTSARASSQSLR